MGKGEQAKSPISLPYYHIVAQQFVHEHNLIHRFSILWCEFVRVVDEGTGTITYLN